MQPVWRKELCSNDQSRLLIRRQSRVLLPRNRKIEYAPRAPGLYMSSRGRERGIPSGGDATRFRQLGQCNESRSPRARIIAGHARCFRDMARLSRTWLRWRVVDNRRSRWVRGDKPRPPGRKIELLSKLLRSFNRRRLMIVAAFHRRRQGRTHRPASIGYGALRDSGRRRRRRRPSPQPGQVYRGRSDISVTSLACRVLIAKRQRWDCWQMFSRATGGTSSGLTSLLGGELAQGLGKPCLVECFGELHRHRCSILDASGAR